MRRADKGQNGEDQNGRRQGVPLVRRALEPGPDLARLDIEHELAREKDGEHQRKQTQRDIDRAGGAGVHPGEEANKGVHGGHIRQQGPLAPGQSSIRREAAVRIRLFTPQAIGRRNDFA